MTEFVHSTVPLAKESPKASTMAQMAGAFAVGDNGNYTSAAATHRRTPEAVVLFSTLSGVLLALGEVPRATARDLRDAVHRVLIHSAGVGRKYRIKKSA